MNAGELLDFGLTYNMRGELEKAEDCLKKALAQNPNLKGAHLGLGDVYLKRDQLDLAEEMYTKELDVNLDSVKANLELANVYILKGEEDKALPNLERVLAISPNDWRAARGMGYIYFIKGELEKASGWFRMALEGKGEDIAVHFWLALIYHQKKFVTEMDTEIEKVRAVCQNMERFVTEPSVATSYILGKIAILQGKHKEAIKHFENLRKRIKIKNRRKMEIGLVYNELDILKTLAEVYEKIGDKVSSSKLQEEIAGLTQSKL
jgi:tetratricopeptide (TPR) repeat protein